MHCYSTLCRNWFLIYRELFSLTYKPVVVLKDTCSNSWKQQNAAEDYRGYHVD